jgi:uroporphyrinogen-III synthase
MRVVLTRQQDDSERSASLLRARGHDALIAPLLQIEPMASELHPHWGGVVITSANAAAAVASHPLRNELIKLPVFAVGKRSAEAARHAGFSQVISAGGDVHDLVRLIAEHRADTKAPLLYLAGESRTGDLIGDLAVHGIAAELTVVYRAVMASFSPALIAALKEGAVDAVLHFSRRSAEFYLESAKNAGLVAQASQVRHICLSGKVAEPLVSAGASRISVAKRPDEASMIALVDTAQG